MKYIITIGDPVSQSNGPNMKQRINELLKIDQEYSFFRYQTNLEKSGEIEKLKDYIIEKNVTGMSVTMPNKSHVITMCNFVDESAKFMNAVNTVQIKDGKLNGYNTDWIGIVNALKNITQINDKKIALLGAGGTTSAALYGLTKYTKNITVFNRTIEKARKLAEIFNVNYNNIQDINVENFDIIINTTSVGFGDENACPIDTAKISSKHIVFDVIYKPMNTKLISESKKNGAKIVYGINMLIYGTFPQMELYTGYKINDQQMLQIVQEFGKN